MKMGSGLKSIGKGLLNVVTFGGYSAHENAKAQKKAAEAEAKAAEEQAKAAKEAAANTPEDQQQAMSAALRDDEKNKLRRRRGMTGTVLTSALGTSGTAVTGANKLGN
jgi:DNA-binding transcriptional regulator YiaG